MYELILTEHDLTALRKSHGNAQEVYSILVECCEFNYVDEEFNFAVPRDLALEIVELGAKEDFNWPGCSDRLTHKLNSFCEIFFT